MSKTQFIFFIVTFLMLILGLDPAISLVSNFQANLSPFGAFAQLILFVCSGLSVYLIIIKLWGGWQAYFPKRPYPLKLDFSLLLLWLIYLGILSFFSLPLNSLKIFHLAAVSLLFLGIPFGVIFSTYSLILSSQLQSKK
ncbi:hypothetical protein [Gloeothece verrucosa]|uniref:Uncharacterized protein n=1 Tax=Gloeothece verrucosa (strain PCC 7822) TaxID=497965 RepID=E0UM92_GLOV7|nr:hypothetical protein [Gloeothece verrucosa]ADN18072.1 hypothetical protein Cyan7822_6272 [Gloeothece verrucosa PCC 7822]